jgi:uncharacterized protein involved in response to NO
MDRVALEAVTLALLAWAVAPGATASSWVALATGFLLFGRLARWQG